MDTKEIVTELYALRAGLSVISIEADKIKKIESMRDNEITKIIDNQFIKIKRETDCGTLKEKVAYINSDKCEADTTSNIIINKKLKNKSKMHIIFAIIICCASLITALTSGAIFSFNCKELIESGIESEPSLFQFFLPIIFIVAFGFVVYCFKFYLLRVIIEYKDYANKMFGYEAFLKDLPKTRSYVNSLYKTSRERIELIQTPCKQLFEVLQSQYISLIDIRDWKHLDLVIFYFESRRAESIKEALQLVDRELQTDYIVQTIRQATIQIRQTIEIAADKICKTINKCFDDLYSQLKRYHDETINQLKTLTNAVNVNNALGEKANCSSDQLASDLHYLIQYKL